MTTTDPWEDRFEAFWADVDLSDPESARARLASLLTERGTDDARAAYERASLHDSLGEEADAIPLYRAALETGLAPELRTQARIQLASSLRNIGDASGSIALLQAVDDADPLSDSARAFLALALFDDGKPAPALRTALQALAPHLPRYQRAASAYAGELRTPARIRVVAVGVLVRDGWVLAEEYADGRGGRFLRAPGGGVEFGEAADDAVRREFREELAVVLDSARRVGIVENIYDADGRRGHEIVYVYAIESSALAALPRGERLPVLDSDTTVGWYRIDSLAAEGLPLYPAGILDLV